MTSRPLATGWTTALGIAALAVCSGECAAQSMFGNRGPTGGQTSFGGTASFGRAGTSGIGTTGSRGAFSGSSGFGSTSSFGGIQSGLGTAGGFGQGGFGQGGFGQGGVGGSALGLGQNTFGQASGFGQALAPGSMVGVSNAGTFVGRGQTGQQQAFQQFGSFSQFNRGSVRTPNQTGNQQMPQRAIRPRQRIAFEYDAPTVAVVNEVVQARFVRVSTRRPELRGVSFALDGAGVARLRGSVASEEARRLAEALVRLEPGVRSVENELVVGTPGATN